VTDAPVTRGRPRSSAADHAIVRATLELLVEEGYRALSVEQVARRAGVGKATIYRRHRDKDELVAAAVRHLHADLQVPEDTGSLLGDFGAVAAQAVAAGGRSDALTFMPRMLAEASGEPELHAIFTECLVEPRRRVLRAVLERARARGDLRADIDPEVAIDLLAGPMIYRLLIGGLDLPALAGHADAVARAAIEGLRPR
jgi:AcrR family transcriptional regulator